MWCSGPNRLFFRSVLFLVVAGSLFLPGRATSQDLGGKIKAAVDRGCGWLAKHRNPDGGYGPYEESRIRDTSDVGITAFVLYALAKNPQEYKAQDGPFISKAVDFLLSRQQKDGGFYDVKDRSLQTYRTSVAVLALTTLDPVRYSESIRKAQEFIKSQQLAEADDYDEAEHTSYGGITYGDGNLRPNLSTVNLSLDALYASGLSGSDELWKRAVVFVTRCQNLETVDPLLRELRIGTTRDGGLHYAPNDTRGPEETLDDGTRLFSSYGSMTYAGLKSYLYARVSKDDIRVKQAFAWISKSFTVKENPGMATKSNPRAGLYGLYYYYHTMAKTLSIYGDPIVIDGRDVEHRWAEELAEQLISLQHPDGYWLNESDRWWENIKALDTSYAIVALVECQEFLKRQAAAEKATAGNEKPPTAKEAATPSESEASERKEKE